MSEAIHVPLRLEWFPLPLCVGQWRLLRGGRLILMAAMESMERYQTHGNHGNQVFDVFDTIPSTPFQPLLWAALPSAASTGVGVECVCVCSNHPSLYLSLSISTVCIIPFSFITSFWKARHSKWAYWTRNILSVLQPIRLAWLITVAGEAWGAWVTPNWLWESWLTECSVGELIGLVCSVTVALFA